MLLWAVIRPQHSHPCATSSCWRLELPTAAVRSVVEQSALLAAPEKSICVSAWAVRENPRLRNVGVQFLLSIKMGVFPGFRRFWGSCERGRFVAMCHLRMMKITIRLRITLQKHLNAGSFRALFHENVLLWQHLLLPFCDSRSRGTDYSQVAGELVS